MCLVADVPDDAVVRRVEDGVQRHGQLDRPEAAREVPAQRRAQRDQLLAQRGRHLAERFARKRSESGRFVDRGQHAYPLAALADRRAVGGAKNRKGSARAQRIR